jgi:hypothetical protein
VATTWLQLKTDAYGITSGTTVTADDKDPAVIALLNAGLASTVANPGGNPALLDSDDPRLTQGAQASASAAVGDLDDTVGSVTATALAAGMAAGVLFTITFTKPFPAVPRYVGLSDRSAVAAGLFVSAKTAASFTVSCRAALAASQVVLCDYRVAA